MCTLLRYVFVPNQQPAADNAGDRKLVLTSRHRSEIEVPAVQLPYLHQHHILGGFRRWGGGQLPAVVHVVVAKGGG